MSKITGLPKTRAFLDAMGLFTVEGRTVIEEMENRIPITGSGSPEGAVEADAGATYYDLDTSAEIRHYVKIVSEQNGDASQGWVAELEEFNIVNVIVMNDTTQYQMSDFKLNKINFILVI